MKPLPTQSPESPRHTGSAIPSLPTGNTGTPPESAPHKHAAGSRHGAYPFLLLTSTLLAAVFCVLYITKPVVVTAARDTQETAPVIKDNSTQIDPIPAPSSSVEQPVAAAPSKTSTPYEQTNLRIQHILTARSPQGEIAKIDLDVPVLYQSRNLRWTAEEISSARELLVKLSDYQEKSQMLRAEGAELLDAWNRLIAASIPSQDLRADSPSSPLNQQNSAILPRPAELDTTELIHIQPTGK